MAVNLLLVGRTGNGKSSTGNSILGAKHFHPRMPRDSIVVQILKEESARDDGSTITVVDGPGIGDSSLNDQRGVKDTIKQVDKAISLCPDGFDAVIQVLNIGVRFTQQEKDSIQMMKSIFGKNIIKTHGIIIMTHGDNFDLDADDEEITFKDWCRNQVGDIVEIFKECNYRCVLFNNRAKDDETLNKQRNELLAIVEKLTSKNGKYTNNNYMDAENYRNKLLVSSNLSALEKENKIVMNEISAEIQQLDVTSGHDSVIDSILDLEGEYNRQKNDLEERMKGLEIPVGIQLDLDSVRTTIDVFKRHAQGHREFRQKYKDFRQISANRYKDTNRKVKKNKRSIPKSEEKSQKCANIDNLHTNRRDTEIADRSTLESRATSPRSYQDSHFKERERKIQKSASTETTKHYDTSMEIAYASTSDVPHRYRNRLLTESCVVM